MQTGLKMRESCCLHKDRHEGSWFLDAFGPDEVVIALICILNKMYIEKFVTFARI